MKATITQGLGALTPSTWSEIADAVELASKKGVARLQFGQDQRPSESYSIVAKITGATQQSGLAVWFYEWSEVIRTSSSVHTFQAAESARLWSTEGLSKAVNLQEVENTSTLAYGIIVTGGINVTAHPGFTVRRVPNNTVVLMDIRRAVNATISCEFSSPNIIDGTCP